MTTRVTVKNENQGKLYAAWDVRVIGAYSGYDVVLRPGEEATFYLCHDDKLPLLVKEIPRPQD